MTYLLVVIGLLIFYVVLSLKTSPQIGLGVIVPLTWLFPAWFFWYVGQGAPNSIVGSGIDVKVGVASGCLLIYCFLPGRTFPLRFVWLDYAMLTLLLTHLLSDTLHGGLSIEVLGRAYAEWYLPYIAGRVCISNKGDLRYLWIVPVGLSVLFAFASLLESLADIQGFEMFAGIRPLEGANRDLERWGVQRAYGPTMHPIYFGVVQLLLYGWAAYAAYLASMRRNNPMWVLSPLPAIAGIICTASRGPVSGLALFAAATIFAYFKRSRLPIVFFVALSVLFGVWNSNEIIDQLERWSGEAKRAIVIHGEHEMHSSVRSRIHMWEVQKIALRRSGLLGFGSTAVSGFPINVPLGEIELDAFKRVWTVDNTYLLMTLRFGYIGVLAFVAAAALSVYQFVRIADCYRGGSVGWLAVFVGGALVAVLVVQATVWMPHEIGFPLVWTFGLSSGLYWTHVHRRLD